VVGLNSGSSERKASFRKDVRDLIVSQDRELPNCFVDGKPCPNPEKGCESSLFGVTASDGKSEVVWSCPRLRGRGRDTV
jgi:hypothetical protein